MCVRGVVRSATNAPDEDFLVEHLLCARGNGGAGEMTRDSFFFPSQQKNRRTVTLVEKKKQLMSYNPSFAPI